MSSTWWRVGAVLENTNSDSLDSDAALVQRRRAGDSTAFAAIYRRYLPAVAAIARRLLGNRSDVEDVVQETFLIAYEQLARLVEPAALRGWIVRIAISRAHRRFRYRQLAQIDAAALVDQQISTTASPEQCAELAPLLARALEMPLALRMPWLLRRAFGEPLDEVALACGCSRATVKRRLVDADARVAQLRRKPIVRAADRGQSRTPISRRSIA